MVGRPHVAQHRTVPASRDPCIVVPVSRPVRRVSRVTSYGVRIWIRGPSAKPVISVATPNTFVWVMIVTSS